jgi:PAS domain S-box-containing protein
VSETEIRVRLESIRVGVTLTVVVCLGSEIYALATWSRPHRVLLTVLFGVALCSVGVIRLLPQERIVRSSRREWFFLTWSALDMALITAVCIADGGPRSPYVFLFVLPTIFAALSYPLWSTFATGMIALGGFGLVAATSNEADLRYDAFVTFALLCSALLCVWQARAGTRERADLVSAATALAESEERTRRILENAHDAYVAMDRDGKIIDWNERAQTLFGWTRAEALGRAVADVIVPPHFRDLHLRGLRHYNETGEGPVLNKRIELSAINRSGE